MAMSQLYRTRLLNRVFLLLNLSFDLDHVLYFLGSIIVSGTIASSVLESINTAFWIFFVSAEKSMSSVCSFWSSRVKNKNSHSMHKSEPRKKNEHITARFSSKAANQHRCILQWGNHQFARIVFLFSFHNSDYFSIS